MIGARVWTLGFMKNKSTNISEWKEKIGSSLLLKKSCGYKKHFVTVFSITIYIVTFSGFCLARVEI